MSIDKRYKLILSREKQFARNLAMKTVGKPTFSVWIILIPVLVVYYIYRYQKFQAAVEVFTKEYIFTKKAALEAAFDITKNGVPKTEAMAACPINQEEVPAEHAKEIIQKQMQEIDLLIDHYVKLLEAEGDSYQSLLKNAYQSRDKYIHFLNLLQQAEREVNLAATHAFSKTEGFSELISRMETNAEALRKEEMNTIFP